MQNCKSIVAIVFERLHYNVVRNDVSFIRSERVNERINTFIVQFPCKISGPYLKQFTCFDIDMVCIIRTDMK